ncbi:hypothetical protein MRBLMI12_001750 [Microbacterium sp. LMI12-1-1.1]|uniref:hypothetical protein n=1 Tax=Microbacterium sp. LMI12-1-1.1 TaxID=3135225 RepID=UPI0034218974
MNEQLESELAAANPFPREEDPGLQDVVRRMADGARDTSLSTPAAGAPWWKRRRIMIPLGLVGVVALTGAAVAIPLSLGINGTWVDLDAQISIVYTTDNGIDVNCRYGIYFGDPANRTAADEQLADFVKNHDWTGIGQRIYDEAIANPFVPGPNDDWEVDNQELRDSFSFNNALNSIIWEEIPKSPQAGWSGGGTSDCTGKLR